MDRDDKGRLVTWTISKYSRDLADLKPFMKEFLIHEIETLDRLAGPAGIVSICDARYATLFSVDLDIARFLQDIVSCYYPGAIKQVGSQI